MAVAFPVLVMALTSAGSQERQPLAMLALVFSGIYAAVLGSAYWLQLTYVPWNIIRGAGEEIAPWVAWNPAGFFWAFETFGYFALEAACLFAALALERGMMPHRIRGGLFALAALGVLFLLTALKDVVFDPTPAADPTGAAGWANAWALSVALAWVITFAFVSGSLARWFAQRSRAARRAADVATRETREASLWQPT